MAEAARGWAAFRTYLAMIKIEHSIFALPFALIGMMWAADGWPGARVFFWILVAMVSARSAAMAFNRIVDRDIDALNPRTRGRALPAGLLSLRQASVFFLISCLLFFVAAGMLNRTALLLSPVALFVILSYSYTKRLTSLSHFVLGLGLGIAPSAAHLAVTEALSWSVVTLSLAVLLWTAGFDIIYSMQDEEFDRQQGLHSLPQALGKARALTVSRLSHVGAVIALLGAGLLRGAGPAYYVGVVAAALLLAYEQSLVRPDDLSRVDVAFFTLNGFVSIGLFGFVWLDLVLG